MAPKIFVVFGASGQQGGAVAKMVAEDPGLGQEYRVRAVVRDLAKPAVNTLKLAGCEVVQADLDDKPSLQRALAGAFCAFLVTASVFDDRIYEREYAQGKTVADVAVESGLHYLIFSTLPSVQRITGGRYTKVWHFDAKYDIEQYIRSLPIGSAFVALGAFMQNLLTTLKPKPVGDGTFAIATSLPTHTQLPWIDATDVSTFVRAILVEPDVFQGRIIHGASQLCRLDDLAQIISQVSGKDVKYNQLSATTFREFLEKLNPIFADDFAEMASYYEEYGYFGPDTADLIQPSINRDFGLLMTLHDFVEGLEFDSDI